MRSRRYVLGFVLQCMFTGAAEHRTDEVQWPEGNKVHERHSKLLREGEFAKKELMRLQKLELSKRPIIAEQAHRTGNSKRDRAREAQQIKYKIPTSTALFSLKQASPSGQTLCLIAVFCCRAQ